MGNYIGLVHAPSLPGLLDRLSDLSCIVLDGVEPPHIRATGCRYPAVLDLWYPEWLPDAALREDAMRADPRPRRDWVLNRHRHPIHSRAPIFIGCRQCIDVDPDDVVRRLCGCSGT